MGKSRTDPAIGDALPGELVTWTWTTWPEDVLDALDLMLVYLGVNNKLQRPAYKHTMTRKSTAEVPMRRALPSKAINKAVRLICPGRANNRPQMLWYVPPGNKLKERLAGAGIDVDTVQVINKRRWAFAYFQLKERKFAHYNSARQEELVNSSTPEPPCEVENWEVTTLTRSARERIEREKLENARWEVNPAAPTMEGVERDLTQRRPEY